MTIGKEIFNALSALIAGSADSQVRLNCLREEIEACIVRPNCIDNGAKRTYITKLLIEILNIDTDGREPEASLRR